MGRHVNENFLNKFLGKNILTEEQKTAIALKNRKANYIKDHLQKLEERKSRTLKKEIREEIDSTVNKVFYRVKDQLNEAKQKAATELIPYFTPYGILYFNKDTQEWFNTFGQAVDPMDFMFEADDGGGISRVERVRFPSVIVPPYPAVPSNLIGAAGGTSQINISWTDNATIPEETQFIVYYRELTYPASPTGFTSSEIGATSVNLVWQDQSTNPEEDAFQIYYYEDPS
jgi:hypothetical protein